MNDLLTQYGVSRYTIFGSEDSSDIDVMFYLDTLPELQICRQIATQAETLISSTKEIDVNLCSIRDGMVNECMKGTIDEVNNMIFFTHGLHEQTHSMPIEMLADRDIERKIARVLRGILSFISRTEYRDIVKPALRGSALDKINALRNIQLSTIKEMGKDKLCVQDFYKLFCFQVGQVIPLIERGAELYTKIEIAKSYPAFRPYLYRESSEFSDIDVYKDMLLDTIMDNIDVTQVYE